MPQRLGITLFFCFTFISLLASCANATLLVEPHHKRMLQKRIPQLIPIPVAPGGAKTRVSSTPTTTDTATAGGASTAGSQVSSGAVSSASSTASTSPSSTSSSSTSSSVSSISSPTLASSPTAPANPAAVTPLPLGPQTQTATASSASSSVSTQPQSDTASTSQQKLTLTIIIVVASSIGGVAILWTVFRKWKLARSSRFDERLQPIEWKPPSEDNHRRRPVSNASSFHSGGGGGGHDFGLDHGHDHTQNNLTPLPEHDFTSLPSNHFAPVGGYADLARGPSPQPPHMMEYGRGPGPVMGGPGYDVNVPLHHQGAYGGRDAYDYTNYNSAPMRY